MNLTLIIFVIFLLIVAVVLSVVLLIIRLRLREEEPDAPIVFNLVSHKSNKRCIGILKQRIVGRAGRELITYIPKDIKSTKKAEKEVRVITDKTINIPSGILSADRDIIIVLPRNVEDLPDEIKNNELGKMMGIYIEEKNYENNVIQALREQKERQETIRLLHGGGELSKEEIQRRNELIEELTKILIKSPERKHIE